MTKERLKGYQAMKREADQLRERLAELEAAMTAPKIQQITGMPGGGSHEGSALENQVARHTELAELYREKLAAMAEEQLAMEQAIAPLDTRERVMLRHRYIEGMTWEGVCVAMSYSRSQVHRIHAAALQKLKNEDE